MTGLNGHGPSAAIPAARIHRFGPPSVMTIEPIEIPEPGEGEVLIRVAAAGVGPWDSWVRSGRSVLPQPLPLTLGADVSGWVERSGDDVGDLHAGEAVFGVTNCRFVGAYAEYALASAQMIAAKPASLCHVEAASVPVVAVTALQMLFDKADLQPGQTVFIHGAAGNVGAFAVQLARLGGIKVIASASREDAGYVRRLGAETVIDVGAEAAKTYAHCADAALDTVGGESQRRLFPLVRPGGVLVSAVSRPDAGMAEQHHVRPVFFIVDVNADDLGRIAELLESRALKTDVGAVLPLTDARVAHEMLEGMRPRGRGKIVLDTAAKQQASAQGRRPAASFDG